MRFAVGLFCWFVTAQSLRAVDGDTFVAKMEIWPNLYKIETVRVLGVDTPELKGPERDRAREAKAFTEEWLSRGDFKIEACRRDSFGRLLAKVSRDDSVLAGELIGKGLGRGRGK